MHSNVNLFMLWYCTYIYSLAFGWLPENYINFVYCVFQAFAREGAKVIATDINADLLKKLAEDCPGIILYSILINTFHFNVQLHVQVLRLIKKMWKLCMCILVVDILMQELKLEFLMWQEQKMSKLLLPLWRR